jgi:hypothetical protein
MKLKFRRKKPPLKIMTKGDLQRIAKQKMIKAAKSVGVEPGKLPIKIDSLPFDVKAGQSYTVSLCPLCKQALTRENTHDVFLNGQRTAVHKTCPEVK